MGLAKSKSKLDAHQDALNNCIVESIDKLRIDRGLGREVCVLNGYQSLYLDLLEIYFRQQGHRTWQENGWVMIRVEPK